MCDYVRARHHRSPLQSEVRRQVAAPTIARRAHRSQCVAPLERQRLSRRWYLLFLDHTIHLLHQGSSWGPAGPFANSLRMGITASMSARVRKPRVHQCDIGPCADETPPQLESRRLLAQAESSTGRRPRPSTEERCGSLVDHVSRSLPSARL
jgi:hypothetical protein